ncbi:Por secretion system C-terminal sorting domain-containing protein [Chryseobacterium taeanense]|uniref:Por secretion system C-terminal sorting domain-containing protein n=1 Tax=Chryseobacterium taeanense TaxID=311334 RepID=A0A1G8G231_9FLAO|nr:endonuclease [Chryseobacterium taeanense]SDH88463.1 Por secretion system C-terminal sorting domain-containing protein [Chryseobacterium taeanense]
MKKILLPIILISSYFAAQAPVGYYDGTSGLSGYALKSKLHDIISEKNINWHYGDLPDFYNQTDLDKYYDHGSENTTLLLDIYSEIPTGPDAYEYTSAQIIGSAGAEGAGWNREHMMPQSTFYSNYPMYSDLFYVVPTDAKINQLRSNYPYGMVGSTIYYTFTNSSRIGNCAIPGVAYTGRVYEPIDEFKGDVARSLLYFAVRYQGKLDTFNFNNNTNPASDTNPLDGTEERAYDPAYIAMLLQWHQQDPVSQREIDRNNAVYALQKNRNPFIDNPSWVNAIWNQTPDTVVPQSPSNLTVTQNSAYFTTVSWSPSASTDVIGYKIYQDGNLVGATGNTTFTVDHLSPSTTYNFTVKAYDNGYLLSSDSNTASATTLASDMYAKDLYISKYLEGSSNNKALEITNKTGHAVNLNNYRLSIQFPSGSNYYFPAPYELEGIIQNNETFVILNPNANFSCYTTSQAKFATAAPQLTFSGSQYLELRYKSSTVDALGVTSTNNSSALANVSLYRKANISQPTATFNSNEWDSYPSDYCQSLGTLSTSDLTSSVSAFRMYPNPVQDQIFIDGKTENIQSAQIIDFSGKQVYSEKQPFRNKKSISVQNLVPGSYLLKIDDKVYQFIKK